MARHVYMQQVLYTSQMSQPNSVVTSCSMRCFIHRIRSSMLWRKHGMRCESSNIGTQSPLCKSHRRSGWRCKSIEEWRFGNARCKWKTTTPSSNASPADSMATQPLRVVTRPPPASPVPPGIRSRNAHTRKMSRRGNAWTASEKAYKRTRDMPQMTMRNAPKPFGDNAPGNFKQSTIAAPTGNCTSSGTKHNGRKLKKTANPGPQPCNTWLSTARKRQQIDKPVTPGKHSIPPSCRNSKN